MDAMGVRLDLHMNGDYLTPMAQTVRAAASATIAGGVALVCGFKYLASEKSREPVGGDAAQALATCPDSAVAIKIGTTEMDNAIAIDNDSLRMGEATRMLTGDHESRVTDTGTSIVVRTAQTSANDNGYFHNRAYTLDLANGQAVAIGFKAGQSANGGLGDEVENAPTPSHNPSALEPTVALSITEGAHGVSLAENTSSIQTTGGKPGQGFQAIAIGIDQQGGKSSAATADDISPTMLSDSHGTPNAVAFAQNTRDETRLVCGNGQNAGATMLKVRCGKDTYTKPDGSTGTAGKGPLASNELSFTLSTVHDQSLVLNHIVRRLTPVECERLQGFPSNFTEVDVFKMTKDEFIAWSLMMGNIECDIDTGCVYTTRGPGGVKCEPRRLNGTPLNGYLVVSIRDGAVKKQCRIHRIVWIAAHGIPADGMVVDHINNDKTDNRIENLQLLTPAENSTKASKDGLYKVEEDAPMAKLTAEQHDEIRAIYETGVASLRSLARRYGISKSRVSQIIHEGSWTRIPYRGKPADDCPDSPRYKALGNSWATNCAEWILRRIVAADRLGLIP